MWRKKISILLYMAASFTMGAQTKIPLYKDSIPNAKPSQLCEDFKNGMYSGVTVPAMEIFLPEHEHANGAAVIIFPGGGYSVLVYDGEGVQTAKALAKAGIVAFVIKYRLPHDESMVDKKNGPLQDALQAIKVVRENAVKWGVNSNKIGVMGFSAGGHLASTVATHYNTPIIDNSNEVSLRPDFQVVVYPVISMQDSLTHLDSRRQLLGDNPTNEVVNLFSNELQVNKNTPPAYITHAADDTLVDVDNSIFYFEHLRKNGVPVEMHIYPKGGHGFIFKHPDWIEPLLNWLNNL